jgi:hypothetical protein
MSRLAWARGKKHVERSHPMSKNQSQAHSSGPENRCVRKRASTASTGTPRKPRWVEGFGRAGLKRTHTRAPKTNNRLRSDRRTRAVTLFVIVTHRLRMDYEGLAQKVARPSTALV